MEVTAGRRTVKEPELGFSGGAVKREKMERRGEKDQEDGRTQELKVLRVPIRDERRVRSQRTVGLIRKKMLSQSLGGRIHEAWHNQVRVSGWDRGREDRRRN
ncbi:hypothetical protein NDU88_010446 [Pleurodeles waltl]|uniref:Uncharacterized protein n=1 Tax=Pleurodeles waltl TaxID=8319 RepID=A0AAV7PUZ3_PLEWA|nr:hypothetical protein NDU88_010446 [Pleurodeles waltl]